MQKVLVSNASLNPAPHAKQPMLRPSAHSGWIGQACRILTVRGRLLRRITSADPLVGLPSTMQAEMPRRRQPVGQNREGLLARPTHSAPRPEGSSLIVVALAKSLSVADDRVVAADRTTPRQKDQRDRSGDDVVFRLWQCDKKNQGWREGPPLTVPCQSFDLLPGLHPLRSQLRTKKEYCFTSADASPTIRTLAGLKRLLVQVDSYRIGDDASALLPCHTAPPT